MKTRDTSTLSPTPTRPTEPRRTISDATVATIITLVLIVVAFAIWALLDPDGMPFLARQRVAPPAGADIFPTDSWLTTTPEEQGVDAAVLADGLEAIQQDGTNIHSLLVVRNGAVILDAYFYPYDGSIYHDLASVTKSMMTTLVGIAEGQGQLDLDQPLLSYFPERSIANRDERKESITVRHLVSLTSGLTCNATNDQVTLGEMRASEDWVQFALDRRVVAEPGTRFVYCGLDMHLLSAVLQEATGMTALEFARQNLFQPLGIEDVYWPADPQGYTHGWGDISLRPPDMARLGYLFLRQGRWGQQQIVPAEWVAQATVPQAATSQDRVDDYGYGWWASRPGSDFTYFSADGNGGQYIRVVPALDLVLVTTGGGFSMGQIDDFLVAALGNAGDPLPANPDANARLETVVANLAPPPAAQPVPPLPEMAETVSGRRYTFQSNTLVQAVRLTFDDPAVAHMQLDAINEPEPRQVEIGLDGIYRSSKGGRPIYARGSWTDDTTFELDYDEGPGLAAYTIRIHFQGDRVEFEVVGLGNFEAREEP